MDPLALGNGSGRDNMLNELASFPLRVGGLDVIPLLICALGAVGLLAYGRRALRDGLRVRA
ncbi:hypothetical protein C439_05735 [Haloferax mediterranei ATCC 33500]|uniref:Uncharacterized protein n=1 Tax=Haloferax mediterranei (strain ATCC 33500 / DSM 1411 / JCM 8866 / NBRC 14739 / NCIMB 2177 / R-4) TaxID=523841 RepID=M0J6Z2_HALMT|nr:hypothetical protein C439_05735 [Haloferax mediterranei ATCC 33500]